MNIKIGYMTIPGVKPTCTDPLPKFRRMTGFQLYTTTGNFPDELKIDLGACTRTLPYRIQNRYTSDRKPTKIKTITLENSYLKATITPEYGGKLWSLYDKVNKRELLMANPVLQPRNLAIRNAWTSGGIEWNFGSLGHTYFTCDNVFCAIMDDNGEQFLRMYEFERAKECVFQIDLFLPENSHCLYSHIKVTNPHNEDKTTYWWTNIAVPEDGKTRILSSSENVIAVCASNLTYEKLPYLSVMDGDLSYPINATRSFDYFYQPKENVKTTWECAVNKDGFTFYDRSTSPLVYHKMFCWGNHRGGKRWQQYLSDDENGDYIEMQAGFARSQMHDKLFPKKSSIEWTQCFGGTFVQKESVHDVNFDSANKYFEKHIDNLVSENDLLNIDNKLKSIALKKTEEKDIVHFGSGWGALELLREKEIKDSELPKNLCFPSCSLTDEQLPWLHLLNKGTIEDTPPSVFPDSWMVSDKWLNILEHSIQSGKSENWVSYLHYGNMLFEYWDYSKTTINVLSWNNAAEYEEKAKQAWLHSIDLCPNVFAYRNLAILFKLKGDNAKAEEYYDKLFALKESLYDFSFASEYMTFLNSIGKYEKSFSLYNTLPSNIQNSDSVTLCFALCCLKLNKLEFVERIFNRDFATIREGETSLTNYWFEYHARLFAKERNISYDENEKELLSEAELNNPPPHKIDFRMSYNKKHQYRATE